MDVFILFNFFFNNAEEPRRFQPHSSAELWSEAAHGPSQRKNRTVRCPFDWWQTQEAAEKHRIGKNDEGQMHEASQRPGCLAGTGWQLHVKKKWSEEKKGTRLKAKRCFHLTPDWFQRAARRVVLRPADPTVMPTWSPGCNERSLCLFQHNVIGWLWMWQRGLLKKKKSKKWPEECLSAGFQATELMFLVAWGFRPFIWKSSSDMKQ